MSDVTTVHEEKSTLSVDVFLPGHSARVTTPLFTRTRKELFERDGGRCFVCGCTEEESGQPLEDHHWLVERCMAEGADWAQVREYIFRLERLIGYAATFARANPTVGDIMDFVDDTMVNGMILCKEHHTTPGTGIHYMDLPRFAFQAYGQVGFQYTAKEKIVHDLPSVVITTEKTITDTVTITPAAAQ